MEGDKNGHVVQDVNVDEKLVIVAPFQHSKRKQIMVILLFFLCYFLLLFLLETWLSYRWHLSNEFAYEEFYSKPFHYKLDPFSYVETKNGKTPISRHKANYIYLNRNNYDDVI